MIATQMWLLLPPLKAILYKVSVEIIFIFLLTIYSSQQKVRGNQIKSFMRFQVFREMSEVVSLYDCHTDVATFTATKGHFVKGKSGNYFARETFVKISNYLTGFPQTYTVLSSGSDPNFKNFGFSKSWSHHFEIYIHGSQNWFQPKTDKLLTVLRFAL